MYNQNWNKEKRKMLTIWPNLSQIKPEPVPSTLTFLSSLSKNSSGESLRLFSISRSLIKTIDGEVSYSYNQKGGNYSTVSQKDMQVFKKKSSCANLAILPEPKWANQISKKLIWAF